LDGLNGQIEAETRILNDLYDVAEALKLPMNGILDPSESSEAHLLNKYDQRSDFPEYEPYFFRSSEMAPL
jgi:hypothetical protein